MEDNMNKPSVSRRDFLRRLAMGAGRRLCSAETSAETTVLGRHAQGAAQCGGLGKKLCRLRGVSAQMSAADTHPEPDVTNRRTAAQVTFI